MNCPALSINSRKQRRGGIHLRRMIGMRAQLGPACDSLSSLRENCQSVAHTASALFPLPERPRQQPLQVCERALHGARPLRLLAAQGDR